MLRASKPAIAAAVSLLILVMTGCGSVGYIKNELTGQAKPEGGTVEIVPATRTYSASSPDVRRAVLSALEEQGYIAEELANGTIRTEPKVLGDPTKFALFGASYSAKVTVKVEGSAVTYRARFDKKSNVTMGEQNVEYPEKENELRKAFFAALDKRLRR